MAEAPTLQTERLTLRSMTLEDFPVLQELWCDPVVYKYIAGRPALAEETWSAILRHAGQWQLLDYGYWVAVKKTSGTVIGQMGYGDFKRAITPSLQGMPELGWALFPQFHNMGYALEATSAIQAWADSHLNVEKTCCIISPENTPSRTLADKLGFKVVAATTYKDTATLVLERRSGVAS